MSLNVNWSLINIYLDPAPGDPAGVRNCADTAKSKRQTVDSLKDDVSLIRSDHDNGSVFVGKAADRFVSRLEDFPSNLSSLSDGLSTISQTLYSWADCMEDCQRRALDAYNRAVDAKNRVSDANSKLFGALGDAATAGTALLVAKRTLGVVGDDADVQRAQQRAKAAQEQVDSFRKKLGKAQGSYDAARRDVSKVRDDYNNGAEIAARGLNGALGDLPPVSVFDRVYYSDVWRTIVKVAEVAGYVVGFVMLFLGPGGILGLLAFALAAIGFLNDLLAYSHGDENLWQVLLGGLSLGFSFMGGFVKQSATGLGGLVKQSAAGLRFFAESKGLPMYQRVLGGLNSSGRNSGMITDFLSEYSKNDMKLIHESGIWKDEKAIKALGMDIITENNKEATRIFNDYQLRSLLPHDWKWLLRKSDLYGVFNQADIETLARYGADTTRRRAIRHARKALQRNAKLSVAKDMVGAARRIEDHRAEGKTGFGAAMTECAGLLAPANSVLGLAGRVADSML